MLIIQVSAWKMACRASNFTHLEQSLTLPHSKTGQFVPPIIFFLKISTQIEAMQSMLVYCSNELIFCIASYFCRLSTKMEITIKNISVGTNWTVLTLSEPKWGPGGQYQFFTSNISKTAKKNWIFLKKSPKNIFWKENDFL